MLLGACFVCSSDLKVEEQQAEKMQGKKQVEMPRDTGQQRRCAHYKQTADGPQAAL